MAKRSLPRPKADSPQLISASLVDVRARAVLKQLTPIQSQLRVLAAASDHMDEGRQPLVQPAHITEALMALIGPCDRLFELIDELSMCRPASEEEREETESIEKATREVRKYAHRPVVQS